MAIKAIKDDWTILQAAPWWVVGNYHLMQVAIEQSGVAIQFAPAKLKRSRWWALMAVRANGAALGFLQDFKSDREIVLAAVACENYADSVGIPLTYAAEDLRTIPFAQGQVKKTHP